MKEMNEEQIRELLKNAMRPVESALQSDLWPRMLRRLEQPSLNVPWFDWALLALLILGLFFVPSAIPVLLYHL